MLKTSAATADAAAGEGSAREVSAREVSAREVSAREVSAREDSAREVSGRGLLFTPGQYVMIGRRKQDDNGSGETGPDGSDTGHEEFIVIPDLKSNARLVDCCDRALYEIGRNDPYTYRFSTMLEVTRRGVRVALDRRTLERYVFVNYQ